MFDLRSWKLDNYGNEHSLLSGIWSAICSHDLHLGTVWPARKNLLCFLSCMHAQVHKCTNCTCLWPWPRNNNTFTIKLVGHSNGARRQMPLQGITTKYLTVFMCMRGLDNWLSHCFDSLHTFFRDFGALCPHYRIHNYPESLLKLRSYSVQP